MAPETEIPKVRFELVPPTTGFSFQDPAGTVVRIEAAGFETDDPRVIGELDMQAAVQRVEAEPVKKAKS